MRKLLNIILTFVLVFTVLMSSSVEVYANETKNFVNKLKIMEGDPNGSFRDNDTLSREEFVKITIAIIEPEFVPINSISPYGDVPYSSWSAGYIQRASQLEYFSGYPDGSFRPHENVLPEQICKIMLKLLGYETENTTANWAQTQISFANNKGLLNDVNYKIGVPISRIDTAKIIQNTLLSQKNSSPQFSIEDMGYKYYEDITIISDENIQSGYISTTVGTFKQGTITNNDISKKGNIIINKKDEITLFIPHIQSYKEYVVQQTLPDRISLYDKDNSISTLMVNKDTILYNGNIKGTYGQVFQTITKGSTVRFVYDKYNMLDYLTISDNTNINDYFEYIIKSVLPDGVIVFDKNIDKFLKCDNDITVYEGDITTLYQNISPTLSLGDKLTAYYDIAGQIKYFTVTRNAIDGPITNINGSFQQQFNLNNNTHVSRDGIMTTIDKIQNYDICYYIKEVDTALIYNKKVTGVYQNALPSKDNIQKIVLSGKQYDIAGVNAFNKLSAGGNILYGETIRILLDKDNKIADVITMGENENLVGFLINTGLKSRIDENEETNIEYYGTVLLTDGTTEEYFTDKDYDNLKGKTVKISFNDGKANIRNLSSKNNIAGSFNWNQKTFDSFKISENINIIDVANSEDYTMGKGIKVYPQRINNSQIKSDDILYIEKNEHSIITDIILNDYTNDLYDYGVVLKDERISTPQRIQGTYDLNVNGNNMTVVTPNSLYSVYTGNSAKFDFDNNIPVGMTQLNTLNESITKVDDLYIYTNNNKYFLSSDVLVYQKVINTSNDGQRYEVIPISKIDYTKNITAHYDKAESHGGRIRVIIIK